MKVEHYEFSEDVQRFFGNDIAYILTVTDMDKLYSSARKNESSVIQWLVEKGIGFVVETEHWA